MALTSKHPSYSACLEDWQKMRVTSKGERAVKEAGTTYLPATSGMELDGMVAGGRGLARYNAYKQRAVFPPYVTRGIKSMVGTIWRKAPVIELPKALERLREKATLNNEGLNLLLRRINEAQLKTGRIGIMLDLPAEPSFDNLPYIVTYEAEKVGNWDDGTRMGRQMLNLVVLDETEYEVDHNFEWKQVQKYRVLRLMEEGKPIYQQAAFREVTQYSELALQPPSFRGRTLEEIPFRFINAADLLPEPCDPPLLELANLCLTIYRGEADYRQSLFMQGQDTLVEIGDGQQKELRVGAGASIHVPMGGGDAKYIGVNSAGLPEQRTALENDRKEAKEMAAQMLDTTSRAKESGEALKTRVAAQTVTLNDIATAGALGLQELLRIAAVWVGANPDQVKVMPNLDFAEGGMTPREYVDLMDAKGKGLPLSAESVHARLKEDEYTEMEFAAEVAMIAKESAAMAARAPAGAMTPPVVQ